MTSLEYTDAASVLHRQEFAYSGDDLAAIERRYENGTLVNETRIMRDGMLAIQDRNGSNATVNEYTWGLNLGGGIGGLLALSQGGSNTTIYMMVKGMSKQSLTIPKLLWQPIGMTRLACC
jgi:hypothetical protein